MILKRGAILSVLFTAVVSMVMGQNASSGANMSVEESYLQQTVDQMIIREQSRSDSREMKLAALEYIKEAIGKGNTGSELQADLDYLALEGILNRTRENGRLVNNFPDIRTLAATYLGDMGTAEANATLIKMVLTEPEPMVLTEVIKSLAKIGINENDETANAISWVATRFDALHPDNMLALSVVDAYDILAQKNNGIKAPAAIRTIIRIADGPYPGPIKDRARQVLINLRRYSAQNSGGR
ncbi:hypothetical protein FACS189468_1310 [Spirochaetia bacterium]|nr:hypothetical protein FACS189468_1310 [Spirochaetia bacterium]